MSFHARKSERVSGNGDGMANNNAITPGQRRLSGVLLNGKIS